MKLIGTVLPTRESIALTEKWAREEAKKDKALAESKLVGLREEVVGGEKRYYKGNFYATVRGQKIRWFEVKSDGDYAVSGPR